MKAPRYLQGSIEEALSYQANCCMLYTGAPQNSKRKAIEDLKVEEARKLALDNGWSLNQIIVHAPYIINLANPVNAETGDFGADFLAQELDRVAAIGADLLVLHPGSHLKQGFEAGKEQLVTRLNRVLDADDSSVTICLETMAGKGSEMGRTFEEMAEILEGIHKQDRVAVCLDTCHIHDAGYDLNDLDGILDQFDSLIGLERLKVIHVNDSKNPCGSHKDRHENIGQGQIGLAPLAAVVHHPKLDGIIKILETPWIDDHAPYKEEIELLLKTV